MEAQEDGKESPITIRVVAVGLIFAALSAYINTYLGLNFGLGINVGAIAIVVAYTLFRRLSGSVSKEELMAVYIISTSLLTAFWTLGVAIYALEKYPEAEVPPWLAPPKDLLSSKCVPPLLWVLPSFVVFMLELISGVAGLLIGAYIASEFAGDERLTFPRLVAVLAVVDACLSGKAATRTLLLSLAIGGFITVIQYLARGLTGLDIMLLDFSSLLPSGMILAISFNVGIISLGYIIGSKASLSVLAASILSYMVAAPVLAHQGLVRCGDAASIYGEMLYKVLLPLAIGILVAGGLASSIRFLVLKVLLKGKISLMRGVQGKRARKLLSLVICFSIIACVVAYILNPFYPLPSWFSPVFVIYSIIMSCFLESIAFVRSLGEVGMGVNSLAIVLYDVPLFLLGYRGYTGYIVGSYFRPAPWVAADLVGFLRYEKSIGLRPWDIIKLRIIGWVVTLVVSIASTILLWRYLGFGTPLMPAIGLLQLGAYYRMFATGSLKYLGPFALHGLVMGCLVGIILEKFQLLSSMGIAIGLLLPPYYSLAIGLGGVVRALTDKLYGPEGFKRVGLTVSSGLMIGTFLAEAIMQALMALGK